MLKRVIIIAEAGVNHNGELDKALALINVAADSKADFIKFQTFKADKVVSKIALKADYQIENYQSESSTQLQMLRNLEIPLYWYPKLIKHANEKGIGFISTGFDEESIDFLDQLNLPFFKIPSGEITNKPLLKHIALKRKSILLSTGMSTLEEVIQAMEILLENKVQRKDITILHCNTEYPTPMEDVNLKAMTSIAQNLNVDIGYSDHTLGFEVSIAAVAMGATVIEKHFTLDRSLPGPDHKASLEPKELRAMVTAIRNIEKALSGTGEKKPSPSELKNRTNTRKSIHTRVNLKKGHKLTEGDLIMKRPGDGISPMEIDNILGRKITQDIGPETKLMWEHLEQ